MDDITKEFGELLNEGSAAGPQYTPEELEAQTTSFLLAFIDQMQVSEEQKAKLRSNIIERALNPENFPTGDSLEKQNGTSPQDIIKLLGLLFLLVVIFGFFGYKLYKSIMEKEQKVKRNKKEAKKEKKVNSPPSSPRSKKEK